MSEPGNTETPVVERPRNLAKKLHLRSVARADALRRENEELRLKSGTDALTGLHNRGYFDEQARRLQAEQARGESIFAVVIMDIDHFKSLVNDMYGHDAGNDVLKLFANIISNSPDKEDKDLIFRKSDYVARIGGDEFGVLMTNFNPDTDAATWSNDLESKITEKLRSRIREHYPQYPEARKVGISLGIASLREGEEFRDAFKRADNMVYQRKEIKGSSR